MASDVTLSNSVRSNLLSLQNTADMLGRTQERLATGKKVNSALDNPSNFFTASALSSRSSDLSSLLDSVSNSVQALKAADTGITGLTKLVESAKATARQALQAPVAHTQKPSVSSGTLSGIKADALTGTASKITGTKAGLTLDQKLNAGSMTIATANNTPTTITIAQDDTVGSVIDSINAVSGLAARLTDTGKLEITSADGTGVQVNYKAGASDLAAGPSETTGTVAIADDAALATAFATDAELVLTAADGSVTSITGTSTTTKAQLLTALNDEGFSAEFDADNNLRVGRADGQSFTASGTGATALGITNGTFVESTQGGSFTAPTPGSSQAIGTTAIADDAALEAETGEINLVAADGDSATYTIATGSTKAALITALADEGFSVSFDAENKLKVSREDGQSFTIAGTGAEKLGLTEDGVNGTTVAAYDAASTAGPLDQLGLSNTYSNKLDGKSLTVSTGSGTGDERTVSVTFGNGTGQVNTIADLNKAFADAGVAVEALVSNGQLKIQSTNAAAGQTFEIEGSALGATGSDAAFTSATGTSKDSTPATFGGSGDEARKAFVKDYNDLLKQINVLAADSSYNGINLLNGDDLSVVFNENGSSKLDIKGVSFDAEGLGLQDITESDFRDSNSVNKVIEKLDGALTSLRSQASKFGSNLSIVETRQNFTKELINVLDTGAANLTLADTNEEGANALALQTRQQLSTTALSLSSQADQAVLRLF